MRIESSQLAVQRYPPFTVKYSPSIGELVRVPDNIPIGIPVFLKRVPSIAGLGDFCDPYDIAGQLNAIAMSFTNSLGVGLEQGTAMDPASFAANLRSQAISLCSKQSWGCPADRCAVPYDQIASLSDQYAKLYTSMLAQKRQQVADGDICVPSLAMFPGIVLSDRARIGCGYGGAAQQQQQQQQQGGSSSGGGSQTVSVQITNASRPGQSFRVGDSFTVTITGPANQQVAVHGTQNGQDKGTTPFSNTDGSGRFTLTGTMTPDTVGNWTEVWTVGNTSAPPVSFAVAAAPTGSSSAPNASSSSSSSAPNGSSSSSSTSNANSFDLSAIMTKLQTPSPVMGLPWLAVILIGGAGIWWLSSRGKRS